eukprot:Skav202816  [mRNA]  locus=scaffold3852:31262:33268:+ [translate_table: standard]
MFDAETFYNMVSKRETREVGILQAYASGKHFTADGLKHYTKKGKRHGVGLCALCGQRDSKQHRLLHCTKLSDVRAKHNQALRWVRRQPEACLLFGVVPSDNRAWDVKKTIPYQLPVLPVVEERTTIFTDGTCYFGEHWDCALAGASVVKWDSCLRVASEVTRFLLPTTDHSAARAEVYAVLRTLQIFTCVDIVTDCGAVVTTLQLILDAHRVGKRYVPTTNTDIWQQIMTLVMQRSVGDVTVRTTKAHVAWRDLPPGSEKDDAYCNECADLSAKKSVIADNFPLWNKMNDIVDHRKQVQQNMQLVHSMICDFHVNFFNRVQEPVEVPDVPNFSEVSPVIAPFSVFAGPSEDDVQACPYGSEYADMFSQWVSSLQWGHGGHCSALEMYISFALTMKCLTPVRLGPNWFVLRQHSTMADIAPLDLNIQSGIWIKTLRWWLRCCAHPIQLERGLGLAKRFVVPVAVEEIHGFLPGGKRSMGDSEAMRSHAVQFPVANQPPSTVGISWLIAG